jgi:hypothetical protein
MRGYITSAAVAAIAVGSQVSCAWTRREPVVYHKAVATYRLPLDLAGVTQIVVRSSLKEGEVQVIASAGQASLSGTMQYCIQGYHGSRKDAGAGPVEPADMTFDLERAGSTLTLRSREWLYIHHSMLYIALSLRVPDGVAVVLKPYSYEELTNPKQR